MKKIIKAQFYMLCVVLVIITFNSCKERKDDDSNVYKTVKIGTQTWMAENLRTTKYRNGDPIPNVTNNEDWRDKTSGAYCNYENAVNSVYGKLYNWYAVSDSRNIAPTGWHVPTADEWETLIDFIGGRSVAGGKMKETGTIHWQTPNMGATNESGFTALPCGDRCFVYGTFLDLGNHGYFWSSTQSGTSYALQFELSYDDTQCYPNHDYKQAGHSVRCVND